MILSKKKAKAFFKERALPRRVEDKVAMEKYRQEHDGKEKKIYRRVAPDEANRGTLYPLCHNGIDTYAHFGIGIGIYFTQLAILVVVTFVCGMIMIIAANEYESSSFGDSNKQAPFSAVCTIQNITATVGCGNGEESCFIQYRPNCALPENAAIADLTMSLIFCVTIFLSRYVEKKIEEELDDSVQTATDYSVVVMDPNPDADDPDEWYNYFSEYGTVRYITVFRRNTDLTDLILKKHKISRKLLESGVSRSKLAPKRQKIEKAYNEINRKLEAAMDEVYPVCRVYVTFETEEDQKHCLSALKIPDLYSRFDIKQGIIDEKHFFRGENVLSIKEPPEPDNILWYNVELTEGEKLQYRSVSFLLSLCVMVACWFIVQYTREVSPFLLAVVIGIIDSSLPTVFFYLTNLGCPQSEGSRQYSIQMRLFLARFLISVIIPYFQTSWSSFLTETEISQIISVQLTTCFFAPLLALADYYGLCLRHVFSARISDTQDELNLNWIGSEWSLAEKYTGLAKVLSVSLFYALISPFSILLSTIAFMCIFLIDNFLLLRRWKNTAMLDAKIAVRLRQQAMLAVFAHMYVTYRLIYAWPMDQAYIKPDGTIENVEKAPPLAFWAITSQPWHTTSQQDILGRYKVAVFLVGCVAFYMFIIEPLIKWYCRCFCFQLKQSSEEQKIGFSELENVQVYYPLVYSPEEITYLCSYTKNIRGHHRPVTMTALQHAGNDSFVEKDHHHDKTAFSSKASTPKDRRSLASLEEGKAEGHSESAPQFSFQNDNITKFGLLHSFSEKDDLSFYIPIPKQSRLLSIVKHYPDALTIVQKKNASKKAVDLESIVPDGSPGRHHHHSHRVMNNLKGRRGFSMIYVNFLLFWKEFYENFLEYDDFLWDSADHLIHHHHHQQQQQQQQQQAKMNYSGPGESADVPSNPNSPERSGLLTALRSNQVQPDSGPEVIDGITEGKNSHQKEIELVETPRRGLFTASSKIIPVDEHKADIPLSPLNPQKPSDTPNDANPTLELGIAASSIPAVTTPAKRFPNVSFEAQDSVAGQSPLSATLAKSEPVFSAPESDEPRLLEKENQNPSHPQIDILDEPVPERVRLKIEPENSRHDVIDAK